MPKFKTPKTNQSLTALRGNENVLVKSRTRRSMSQFQQTHLETNFEAWKAERCPEFTPSKAFEIYCIEQILKSKEPSNDDIDYGLLPDGVRAVDGFYFYFDSTLVKEDEDLPGARIAELFLIQTKYTASWNEDSVHRMKSFVEGCFDWNIHVDSIKDLPTELKDLIKLFRKTCDSIMKKPVELIVSFFFVTKSPNPASSGVNNRALELKSYVAKTLSAKAVNVNFWGCSELLQSIRTVPPKTVWIPCTSLLMTIDGCAVGLIKLPDFAVFLKNQQTGLINSNFFQSNVRDFLRNTKINTEISDTLKTSTPNFWWLNNGVTIIAQSCSQERGNLKIEDPEIVNGLQTSHQIFAHFEASSLSDERHVLVRVISTNDDHLKAKIIKATNFQNPMDELQLKSSDTVNFYILDVLKKYGFYFDRRRGQSRAENRPISKTITPYQLAQMVLIVFLQSPSDARSKPTSTIAKKYGEIFNDGYNPKLYVSCVLVFKKVCELMDKFVGDDDVNKRIRNHVSTLVACGMTKSANPTPEMLAGVLEQLISTGVEESIFNECLSVVRAQYDTNPVDKYAKSVEFQNAIKNIASTKWPAI
jgi:hypothetical protein